MAVRVGSNAAQPNPGPTVGGSRAQRTTGSALRPKPKPKRKVKAKAKPKARPRAAVADPFNAPLTPDTLSQQVNAQTQLYAGPAESELAGERAVHQQQMTAVPAWYQEYQEALAAARVNTAAGYGAALGQQQQTADTSSALDATQRAAQGAEMQASAAQRGASVDPAIAAAGQQAAASRRGALDIQRNLTGTLGAAQNAYRANAEVVGAGQKVRAMETEATRGRNIDKSARELSLKKGAFATKTRQELIDKEHTKTLERKAFGLNVAKADADVQNDAAKLKLDAAAADARATLDAARLTNDAARIQIAERQVQVAEGRAATYAATAGKSGTKAGTKISQSARVSTGKARSDIEYARRQIQALRTHNVPVKDAEGKPVLGKDGRPKLKPAKLTGAQIRQALLNGDGPLRPVNNDAINAAFKLLEAGGGYLSAAQISGLRRAYPGIRIADLGYQTENGRARQRSSGGGAGSPGTVRGGR